MICVDTSFRNDVTFNGLKPPYALDLISTQWTRYLGQLGGLLLGSVPTIIFIVLLYLHLYVAVVHKPLVAVLAERRSRTEGAVEKARADIAKAEARTAEYEQRLAGSAHGGI